MAETLDVTSMLPNQFQPKLQNRFILGIEGIDAYLCKSAARPTYTTTDIEIPWINSRRYIAGTTVFEQLEVRLHDAIAPSGAQQVMEWIRLHYESVSGRAGYADFYKRDIQLKILDPVGTVVEQWEIKGAFLTNINFGELSQEGGNELLEVTLSIRFDNAILLF